MSDIVERLRWRAENTNTPAATTPMLCAEAADTITALRAEVDKLRAAVVDIAASLTAAISLLERGGKKAAPSDVMFFMMLADYKKSLNNSLAALGEQHE